jgi:hypothetical protein
MEVLTLIQTGKRDPIPIVMLDLPDGRYWHHWRAFITEHLVTPGYVEPLDLGLVSMAHDPQDVVARIQTFYRRFHSLRYVGDKLVLRLTDALSAAQTAALNEAFADMLVPGGTIAAGTALPAENDTPALVHLPRLIIDFDRRQFARLHRCIDYINSL